MVNDGFSRRAATAKVRHIGARTSAAGRAVVPPYRALLDTAPVNVVFADSELVIRYLNPAAIATLHTVAHLLPVPVKHVVGSPVDVFRLESEQQRKMLADPGRLPRRALITLGADRVEVQVSAIHDADDRYLGAMMTWPVAPERTVDDASRRPAVTTSAAKLAAAAGAEGTAPDESGDVIERITGVDRRAQLLARDAELEAARAVDAGKGLVVVAKAVKQLAHETVKVTEDLRRDIDAAGIADESVVEAIRLVGAIVARMNEIQSTIASAVERQTATANEIARNVGEAANGSNDIAHNVVRVTEAAWRVSAATDDSPPLGGELARTRSELQALVLRLRH